MKSLYKAFSLIALSFIAFSCNLDYFPSDAVSSEQMQDVDNAVTATNGNYAMFKAILEYDGTVYSANSYIRHFLQMAEFHGDNTLLSGYTTDPLCTATRYESISTEGNVGYFWWIAYKAIYGANAMIEVIQEGQSTEMDHILGENYFIRAVCHLHLSMIYSRPYTHGRDNMGVVLRTSTDCSVTKRATVGEVYDQIVSDLEKAAGLMSVGSRRGNNGYANKEAAQGILSRVYLYMEENQKCVDLVNEMLAGADPGSKLSSDYEHMFQYSKTDPEVLWCIAMVDSTSDWTDQKGSVGSMFYTTTSIGGTGWAEIYYSQPLIDLFNRYPQDIRFTQISEPFAEDEERKMVYWPIEDDGINDFRSNYIDESPTYDEITDTYTCVDTDGNTRTVQTEMVDGYPKTYITVGGTKTYVSVSNYCYKRETFPAVLMKKFANMDGQSNVLSSPIMIRWAEVILNRAEANAKLGNEQDALDDVNVIRTRAGLTGDAQFTMSNYNGRGYTDILDVVLDERRMELCFEGHRPMDVFRNKKDMDRRYAGYQQWSVISWDDSRIPYPIPYGEISVSGIPQN